MISRSKFIFLLFAFAILTQEPENRRTLAGVEAFSGNVPIANYPNVGSKPCSRLHHASITKSMITVCGSRIFSCEQAVDENITGRNRSEPTQKYRIQIPFLQDPKPNGFTKISASLAAAVTIFFGSGWTVPVVANAAPTDSGGAAEIDLSELKESLRPATQSRPAIPFPTNEALLEASKQSNKQPQEQYPVPQDNLLPGGDSPYTMQAMIALESLPGRERPYNGADALVVKVWPDEPASTASTKPLGGAKIPIGAVVGGFPIRISLGPQNAIEETEWKANLSSQSLWLTASICRTSEGATGDDGIKAETTNYCSYDYSTPIVEGTAFSKWIELGGSSTGGGIRAPASILLGYPR